MIVAGMYCIGQRKFVSLQQLVDHYQVDFETQYFFIIQLLPCDLMDPKKCFLLPEPDRGVCWGGRWCQRELQSGLPGYWTTCEISTYADGGPRSRVCARETLCSAPHRRTRKFSGARVCRVTLKNLPKPIVASSCTLWGTS